MIFLLLSVLSTHAWCVAGDHYALVKLGRIAVKENNATHLTTLGYIYGIGLTRRLSVELDGNVSTQGGNYSSANKTGKYEVTTLGGYIVHRESITPLTYAKAKVGVILSRVGISNDIEQKNTQTTNIEASLGLGLGWAIPIGEVRYTFEIEASKLEKNLLLFGLGINIAF